MPDSTPRGAAPPAPERIAVVLASAGRPSLLGDVIDDLSRQTRRDVTLVVCVPDAASLPDSPLPEGTLLAHARGLAAQRNAALDLVPDATHVFCFDDDAVMREDYLERAMAFFNTNPAVVGLTGLVLLDGAAGSVGTPVGREESERALAASSVQPPSGQWRPSRELYGCNFAYRAAAANGERFDARLPLYSWLEDHDFARRLMRHGQLAKVDDCVVVHRGVKSGGRMAHERLGYSQVMNPAYLHHTGSFPLWLALLEAGRRVAKNAVGAAAGPEAAWRRERLRGNLRAGADVARRRFTPERILDLPVPSS